VGADLLDKNQGFVSGKNVRSAARLPIVAVDLYGDRCDVAYFPPMEKKDDAAAAAGGDEMVAMMRAMDRAKRGTLVRSVGGLFDDGGDHGADVALRRDDAESYKAVRRYLNKGGGCGAVLDAALVTSKKKKEEEGEEEDVIVIPRPHLVMGARRTSELNPAARSAFASLLPKDDDKAATSLAIERDDDDDDPSSAISLTTINMDGNAAPKGDDYDRVAYRMRLNSRKKPVTMLPEEALALIVARCKRSAKEGYLKEHPDSELNEEGGDEGEETYMDYPAAFAIPGWATTDATIEALVDASRGGSGGGCGPSLHQRSVAACVGALAPPPVPKVKKVGGQGQQQTLPASDLFKLLTETMKSKDADAAKEAARTAALERRDPTDPDPFVPLVVLAGATREGIELTAVQISKPQRPDEELHCPFGNISVISSVCHASPRPLGMLEGSLDDLRANIGAAVPESEEPTAFVTYGTLATQNELASNLKRVLKNYGKVGEDDDDWDGWDQDVPIVPTGEEIVSTGLSILAASVHGRVRRVESVQGTDGKMRPKARIGVAVQDAATCAVAVSFRYLGDKWTDPRTIFDFDRRVPAGPYRIDFTAAECAAHVEHARKTGETSLEEEAALIEATGKMEGSRGIPQREKAALGLRFRIYQRSTRHDDGDEGGKWIRIGDDHRPLTMEHSQKDEGEDGEGNLVAIESAVAEISLNAVGLISFGLVTNGESIVQATKSARNSKLLKWTGILGSILFFGGFLVKSYVEERVFERDTQRVLAYYKHAAANSFHDGDERQARYLVWKYKGKKEKLWRRLEVKYGEPVRHAWEWDDLEEAKEEGEEEAEDLDSEGDDEQGSEKSSEGDGEEL